jgi:hypothetical protein
MDATGQPIMVRKSSVTIEKVEFCGESAKFIGEEVAKGKRPVDWNVPGTAGELQYKNILATKKLEIWDGRSPSFGFCRVFVPQGVQLMAIAQPTAGATTVTVDPANIQGQVRNALNPATIVVQPAVAQEQKFTLADGTPCTKDGVPLTQVANAGAVANGNALVY